MLDEFSVLKLVTSRLEGAGIAYMRPAQRGAAMNDTPPEAGAAFTALLMQRSEGERAKMAFEMFDLARVLMTADIRARHPGITETELREQIFERTYGSDFDEGDRARIARRIRGGSGDERP